MSVGVSRSACLLALLTLCRCGGAVEATAPEAGPLVTPVVLATDSGTGQTGPTDATTILGDGSTVLPDASLPPDSGHPDAGHVFPDASDYCGPASALVGQGCGDPSSDPHNCGGCGVDCDGGACDGGSCVPLPSGVLATGQYQPYGLAVDSEAVYWLNLGFTTEGMHNPPMYSAGQVLRCPISGCGNRPTVLATLPPGMIGYGTPVPSVLTLAGGEVVWAQSSGFAACSTQGCGCAPLTLLDGYSGVGVTVVGSAAFFAVNPPGIITCPLAGCGGAPTILLGGIALGLTNDGTNVYYSAEGEIGTFVATPPADGGNGPTRLWTGTGTQSDTVGITVDATHLYWANAQPGPYGSVLQCDKDNCGATVVTLASGLAEPRGIAVDDVNVYWAESDGVVRGAIGGCGNAPTQVESTPSAAVAVDATNLYYATYAESVNQTNGWIGIMPKP